MPVSEAENFIWVDTVGSAPQGDESPVAVAASGQPRGLAQAPEISSVPVPCASTGECQQFCWFLSLQGEPLLLGEA